MPRRLNYYVAPNTVFAFATFEFTFLSLVFSILALMSGRYIDALQGSCAIVTFDTSFVAAAIQSHLNSTVPITTIPDWYELHYLTVCHGQWANGSSTNGKNFATIVCDHPATGYSFSLVTELAAVVPPAAAPLLANWPSGYGTVPTAASFDLLAASLALGIISALCYLYGLVKAPKFLPGTNLNVLRIGFFTGVAAAILFSNSAAQITSKAFKQKGMSLADVPVPVNVWTDIGFYVFVWFGAALSWAAAFVGTAFSMVLTGRWAQWAQTERSSPVHERLVT